jgi:hypothetical protein
MEGGTMRLSSKTLEATAEIITGNSQLSPYQTLWQTTTFFRNFGERDIHPNSGAPSRFSYAFEKLEKFNDTDTIAKIICASLQFWEAKPALDPEKAAAHLNKYLVQDGYRLELEFASSHMNGDKLEEYNPYFELRSLRTSVIETVTLVRLSHDSINEHVVKARRKVEGNDLAGAIASSYTLVEELLKELLRETGTTFNENEGDIRQLYTLAKGKLNLDPKGESLENYLKAILDGLQKQVGGLFQLANKASDRHARRYNPAKHHAKLAVNAAFTLCEFLLESYEYQQSLVAKKKTS